MKKTMGLMILLAIGFGWWKQLSRQPQSSISQVMTPSPSQLPQITPKIVTVRDEIMSYGWFQAIEMPRLDLHANYTEATQSKEVVDRGDCEFLVNAGFYDETRQPIGWVVVNAIELNPWQNNRLFDGLVIRQNGRWLITKNKPAGWVSEAIQSGPVIIYEGKERQLSEPGSKKRRIVAIETSTDDFGFAVLYDPETIFGGPQISRVGTWLRQIALDNGFEIRNAINLDGGSASFYYEKEGLYLKEFEPVGSYFCYLKDEN